MTPADSLSCSLTVVCVCVSVCVCVCGHRGGGSVDRGDGETVSVPLLVSAASEPPAGPRAGVRLHRGHR